ncbi:MAG TPA: uracil-DNA glycosylase family protein [Gemmatimonadaceae bacterium]|nr:uracil-DNA glycosylase family protein [Gemmatimonadaceae bacterium]
MSGRRALPLPVLLDRHRAALADCRRCGNAPDVLPVLSQARAPRVMLVGQAPGQTEMTTRRPFNGRAGRTLFRWLERAGLDEATARARIYFAAVTRCYPGPHPSGRGDRVPTPRERALCRDWMVAELRIIRPALLVLAGRLAIDQFLPGRALDQVVGRVHEVEHAGGRTRALPLPHPSGASSWFHVPANARLLDRALVLLREELDAIDRLDARELAG